MNHWFYLATAIVTEVIATSALKASEGFSKPLPSVVVVIGYLVSFYFLSLTLKTIPVGIAYAIWSGVGIVLQHDRTLTAFDKRLTSHHWVFFCLTAVREALETAGHTFSLRKILSTSLYSG